MPRSPFLLGGGPEAFFQGIPEACSRFFPNLWNSIVEAMQWDSLWSLEIPAIPQEINDNPVVTTDIAGDAAGAFGGGYDPSLGPILWLLLLSTLLATGISLTYFPLILTFFR